MVVMIYPEELTKVILPTLGYTELNFNSMKCALGSSRVSQMVTVSRSRLSKDELLSTILKPAGTPSATLPLIVTAEHATQTLHQSTLNSM